MIKKKIRHLYTPMEMTRELQKLGEFYEKKEAGMYYGVVFFIALIMGVLLGLKWYFILGVGALSLMFVPQLFYNSKKQRYEMRRFQDANAYMSQVSQSFAGTKNILQALKETGNTFSTGDMANTISEAIDIMQSAEADVKTQTKKALEHIEERYSCERLHTLHEYFYEAAFTGGDCSIQFKILEKMRIVWENALADSYRSLVSIRNQVTVIFVTLILLVAFLLNTFSKEFPLNNLMLVQITNMILIILFVALFTILDRRLNSNLLRDARFMTQEQVDAAFHYIHSFDKKKERKKYAIYSVLLAVINVTYFLMYRDWIVLGIGSVLFVLSLNLHKIILLINVRTIKSEISKAFPKWLFNVMLLMQQESVEMAIIKSVKNAPPVLKAEVNRISNVLMNSPGDPDAYMSFMADFNIVGIEPAMRKLYSLSVGTGGGKDIMNIIIESNMEMLTVAEKESLMNRSSWSSLLTMVPLLPIAVVFIVYTIGLLVIVLNQIAAMI